MITRTKISPHAQHTGFFTPGNASEHFLVVTSDPGAGLQDALSQVEERYLAALGGAGLSPETQVFSRVYLSDVANQSPFLRGSSLYARLKTGALSVVGQSCLNGGAVSLFSYHVSAARGTMQRRRVSEDAHGRNSMLLSLDNYSLLWNAGYSGIGAFDSYAQTQEVFQSLGGSIENQGMTLLSHTVRSWIYVRDVDNHYKGMVKARREFFTDRGLTEKTRYLASTGIEGKSESVGSLVTVDALSIGGLRDGQITRMDALDHMPRTIDYGVTFERGLRVRFGDRSHLYVSGTASIGKDGSVLHPGDVRKQTERTIENVTALLATEGAALNDLSYLLVYVRDFHDYGAVREILSPLIASDLPVLFLHAAVCRPAWLVEMEGVAVIPDADRFPAFA